ncbi:hypothetical protein SAMN04490203_2468 [Pseudomonas taetrolens]|uniref:Uncharacterized protein n=1 Tax=Pseudomonas taetrolens TaxID=47884 RepID=A0A1H4SRD1_PSETA|nr:hypothetical protein SAMN04490203_2468 [Pseudomonas taetrolens]SQF86621.1 Uncharacterised protein [Pseudomonas taetrolens]VEH49697.1 Uncharacterised protein [Pseudomonas taetrolens]
MTTFQFLTGMIFCFIGLGVRAYLVMFKDQESVTSHSKNRKKQTASSED